VSKYGLKQRNPERAPFGLAGKVEESGFLGVDIAYGG